MHSLPLFLILLVLFFEDIDNSSHDLSEDVDEDSARHFGSAQSHRAQQLKLAEGWSSIRDSILDGMVQ